jgi:hydrogenase maturation protease
MNDSPDTDSRAPRLLVLGLGNELLRDDAIGLRLAEAVREHLSRHPNVTVVESPEMGLGLLDLVADFDEVIVVDAVQTGRAPPGHVYEVDASEVPLLTGGSPHCLGIAEMLALARELHLPLPRHIRIFAVEVADPFTLSHQLTPELDAALPQLTVELERFVDAAAGVSPQSSGS